MLQIKGLNLYHKKIDIFYHLNIVFLYFYFLLSLEKLILKCVQDWFCMFLFMAFLQVSNNGESVQLDHDYCCGTKSEGLILPPRNFYQTDVSDYSSSMYSRLPDYYIALAPEKALLPSKENKDWAEKNSRKDSGLESGDVSDASEEVPPPPKTMSMVSVLKRNIFTHNSVSVTPTTTLSTSCATTMTVSTSNCCNTNEAITEQPSVTVTEPSRKKKLNLEEYRSRRERERIQGTDNSSSQNSQSQGSPSSVSKNPDAIGNFLFSINCF